MSVNDSTFELAKRIDDIPDPTETYSEAEKAVLMAITMKNHEHSDNEILDYCNEHYGTCIDELNLEEFMEDYC